jgi:CCR4-NOT transcriptional regulation complex NOT5 subunit
MQVINALGRVMLLTAAEEFNPAAAPFYEFTKALVDRYGFAKSPKTLEEWQNQSGAEFLYGRWEGTEITRLQVYARGVALDTKVSTEESNRVLDEMLSWAAERLKITFRASSQHRRLIQSELVFTSDMSLDAINPAVKVIADALSTSVSAQWRQTFSYQTSGFALGVDESNVKFPPTRFRLEMREGSAFADKAYYSLAPVHTDQHKQMLQRIEAALTATKS